MFNYKVLIRVSDKKKKKKYCDTRTKLYVSQYLFKRLKYSGFLSSVVTRKKYTDFFKYYIRTRCEKLIITVIKY